MDQPAFREGLSHNGRRLFLPDPSVLTGFLSETCGGGGQESRSSTVVCPPADQSIDRLCSCSYGEAAWIVAQTVGGGRGSAQVFVLSWTMTLCLRLRARWHCINTLSHTLTVPLLSGSTWNLLACCSEIRVRMDARSEAPAGYTILLTPGASSPQVHLALGC